MDEEWKRVALQQQVRTTLTSDYVLCKKKTKLQILLFKSNLEIIVIESVVMWSLCWQSRPVAHRLTEDPVSKQSR